MIPWHSVTKQFREMEARQMIEDTENYEMLTTPNMRLDMEVGQAIRHFYALKVMDVLDYATLGETAPRDKVTAIVRVVGAQKQFATASSYQVLARDLISIVQHFAEKYGLTKSEEKEDAIPFS